MSKPIKRALISVSDKNNLLDICKFIERNGVEILSTGGTANAVQKAGIKVKEVSKHTKFPEILDGRVKTLHPVIHGGLLGVRGNNEHEVSMNKNGISPIDLLIVNLYPFEETITKGENFETCIENIDIGGPALIRAAAKNHKFVTVVVDSDDYERVVLDMKENDGATSLTLRKELAAKAYSRTGAYDAAISEWFNKQIGETFPKRVIFSGERKSILRYGENPHQVAALYKSLDSRSGVSTAKQLQGKELSFNNLNDTDAAFELVREFSDTACAIIKHANPCGIAIGGSQRDTYLKALSCDPISAFGGIIAFNKTVNSETAEEIIKLFAEVIIAPNIEKDARKILKTKKNLRVLITGKMPKTSFPGINIRNLAGGYLLQSYDNTIAPEKLTIVTKRSPTDKELADLRFAFTICKHVKSNAIIYVKDGMTVGIGAGQMSRIDSSRIAAWKAQEASENAGEKESRAKGSVVASDAFFPFSDGLLAAAEAGVTAIIQPGGSLRDDEVIAAADEKGLAMVFTGVRHFRH